MTNRAEPIAVDDFEAIAAEQMAEADFAEVESFAEGNLTQRRTRAAWDSIALRPRILPGAAEPEPSTSVFGTPLRMPVLLAPAGDHRRAHPDGELASARAAAAAGTILVVSANPGHPVEAVAAAADGPPWQQLYLYRSRDESLRRVRLAEDLGFGAICLTLDAHWPAKRAWRAQRVASAAVAEPTSSDPGATAGDRIRHRVLPPASRTWADPAATWDDVAWLRSITRLPIIAKGIMTGEDALACVEAGLDGVIVSNHGGRLDNTQATIEVLPEIVAAVGGSAEILLDGGVRRGADVVKALALGARAVLIGRPLFWGLAAGGEAGLLRLLDILREEIELTMMLCGRPSLDRLDASLVTPLPPLAAGHARG